MFVFFCRWTDAEKTGIGRGHVLDRGHVFVGQGRIDKGIFPRDMARDVGADHRRKLARLKIEPAIFPRREADRVFIEPQLRAFVAGIEPAIDARLGENVNGTAELGVDEQTQPRIEERVARRADEAGSRAAEMIRFEVERTADAGADVAIQRGESERFIDAIEKILGRRVARCRRQGNRDHG